LIDERVDAKDLTSIIYQRAVNRYIKICAEPDHPKKYFIKKLKNLPENTKKYQLDLFNDLFES
jgi:hypothetical protein